MDKFKRGDIVHNKRYRGQVVKVPSNKTKTYVCKRCDGMGMFCSNENDLILIKR